MIAFFSNNLVEALMPTKCVPLSIVLGLAFSRLAMGAPDGALDNSPTLIVHHGKILTADAQFRIAEALAVRGDRIVAVGENSHVLGLAGPKTQQIDLRGKTVLPGLIDSHVHPVDASLYEFDHPVPEMETVADVLRYIRSRADVLPPGQWICVQQVFITRLRDRRFPTRQELDDVAPRHPVVFRTGPDASVNSLAMKLSGIDKDFQVSDGQPGYLERDPRSGEPTGILRNCHRFVKYKPSSKSPTEADRREQLRALLGWLGMWTTLVRQPRWTDQPLHVEQRLTREQALRLYTVNNAFLMFEEKEKGSLEPGKLADFVVIEKDLLTCPVEEVKDLEVEQTFLGGKPVFAAKKAAKSQ
jgi:predicted amidohydrolase YtcJ